MTSSRNLSVSCYTLLIFFVPMFCALHTWKPFAGFYATKLWSISTQDYSLYYFHKAWLSMLSSYWPKFEIAVTSQSLRIEFRACSTSYTLLRQSLKVPKLPRMGLNSQFSCLCLPWIIDLSYYAQLSSLIINEKLEALLLHLFMLGSDAFPFRMRTDYLNPGTHDNV